MPQSMRSVRELSYAGMSRSFAAQSKIAWTLTVEGEHLLAGFAELDAVEVMYPMIFTQEPVSV